ncbi:MAG: molybdopterin molybdotransferase MoeA [Bacillota bacterium]
MYLDRGKYVTRMEALETLRTLWNPSLSEEQVDLHEAAGRVLAQDIASVNTLPVFRASMMDGVAVSYEKLIQESGGNFPWTGTLPYALADTGDDFDDAYDTILATEDVQRHADGSITITPEEPVKKGQYIKSCGATLCAGQHLLKKGTRLLPLYLALLGTAGICKVPVYKKPAVAYIPTGNELIPIGTTPARGQNIESNSAMVQAMLASWGAQARCYPILKDNLAAMEQALMDACANAEMILLNGGSSMGSEDYASRLLQKHAEWFQHGIRSIPGIPIALALIKGKPVINLPGPTLATYYAMDWCVKALVCHMLGQPTPKRRTLDIALEKKIQKPEHLEMYYRLRVKEEGGRHTAEVLTPSGGFVNLITGCDALFIAPIGRDAFEAGETVNVELLSNFDI